VDVGEYGASRLWMETLCAGSTAAMAAVARRASQTRWSDGEGASHCCCYCGVAADMLGGAAFR
jgi:hypothetical protein